jgi:hypothetical protein
VKPQSRFADVSVDLLTVGHVELAKQELEAGKLSPLGERALYALARVHLERRNQLELAEREIERLEARVAGIDQLAGELSGDLFDQKQRTDLLRAYIEYIAKKTWWPRFSLRRIAREALECLS